jgi:hypothetical protein
MPPYALSRPWWAREDRMSIRKLRQRELFGTDAPAAEPTLPQEALQEARALLTQWLQALSHAMMRENGGDEQDQR